MSVIMPKQVEKTENQLLSDSVRAEIDAWIAKFPEDKKVSAVLSALTIVQRENGGWLTEQLIDAVANYLEMPKISVYEVVTFYSLFDLKPVGRHKVDVCTNISCKLRGSADVVKHLEQSLGIKLGETTSDNRITLRGVECLGACVGAPMMQIGNNYHENLTSEKVDKILEKLS